MAMTIVSSGSHGTMVEMNTTPLIDVMLVLLVMLIVTIPVQTHAVKLEMPTATPAPTSVSHVLAIDFDGAITWDGRLVSNRATLDTVFSQIARQPQQDEIHLLPNRLASYQTVARILADAQRLGVKRIGFAGEEQYAH